MCKKRRVSTIATHSLSSIVPPITYKSAMSHKIHFCPLDWREKTTARKFLDHLRANKPGEVKMSAGKPVSVDAAAAHISKLVSKFLVNDSSKRTCLDYRFLTMVDPNQMVFMEDSTKKVISLPPLTNSEDSKVLVLTINYYQPIIIDPELQSISCLIVVPTACFR